MEHYEKCVATEFLQSEGPPLAEITAARCATVRKLLYQTLSALEYLNELGIVSRNISAETARLDDVGNLKLSNFAFNHIVEHGTSINFPLGSPRYWAPERISQLSKIPSTFGEDVWAAGILALEVLCGCQFGPESADDKAAWIKHFTLISQLANEQRYGDPFDEAPQSPEKQYTSDVASLQRLVGPRLAELLATCLAQDLIGAIALCLTPLPSARPLATEILSHPAFMPLQKSQEPSNHSSLASVHLDEIQDVPDTTITALKRKQQEHRDLMTPTEAAVLDAVARADNPLYGLNPDEAYYLWTLAKGDAEAEIIKLGLIVQDPPICVVPPVIRNGLDTRRRRRGKSDALQAPVTLDLSALSTRLRTSSTLDLFPELLPLGDGTLPPAKQMDGSSLPLLIREGDLDYQMQRVVVLRRLIGGLPYTREFVRLEAKLDIPPLCRGMMWCVLLDVDFASAAEKYASIDKDVLTSMDHQLDLDIPRCHQYDMFLSSPTGHIKLKQILKAWVVSHPHLTYWQGLDSLCAPFLKLNINRPHLAYACFSAFINRYLKNFFLKDNSATVNEYLAVFTHLIAYHDPVLASYINSIGFIPELYSISWFLTCFAHVFPLEKLYHLWDRLLLGDSRMPLCVGAAILILLRTEILESDFNACILRFSDVPEVDVEMCAKTAMDICRDTPPSILARRESTPDGEPQPTQVEDARKRRLQPSPSLSMKDFEDLYGDGGGLVVIDTRNSGEYAGLRLPHSSYNLSADDAFQPDDTLKPEYLAELTRLFGPGRPRRLHIVLACHRPSLEPKLSKILVEGGFPRVSVLLGGIATLKARNMLVPPDPFR